MSGQQPEAQAAAPGGPALNTRLAAVAAAATAAAAALAANAPLPQQPLQQAAAASGAAPVDVSTQAIQALTAVLGQQHLDAVAMRAEAAASRAAQEAAAELALAQQSRAAAGPAPLFVGKSNDIEVHRWLIALERWFGSARIVPADDAARIDNAAASLRGSAQSWWAVEISSGRAAAITTWAMFATVVRKHFLPMDTERWAMQQRDRLVNTGARDIAAYTAMYTELDMLLPGESGLSRVMAYERGLPEAYRVKCAERRFATLAEATTAMLAAWNARESARGTHSSLSHADTDEMEADTGLPGPSARASSAASAMSAPSSGQGNEDRIVERIMAMMAERFPGRGRGKSHRGGRPKQRGEEGVDNSKRPPHARTPGISEELAKARLRAHQCIQCGEDGHFARDCQNPVKSN
jgi:hypothetical protein